MDDLAEGQRAELVRQLALIGLDRVAGVFSAGAVQRAAAHGAAVATVPQVTADELFRHLAQKDAIVVDEALGERAVLLAQPLPYAGFEAVFNRTLNFNFEAQEP